MCLSVCVCVGEGGWGGTWDGLSPLRLDLGGGSCRVHHGLVEPLQTEHARHVRHAALLRNTTGSGNVTNDRTHRVNYVTHKELNKLSNLIHIKNFFFFKTSERVATLYMTRKILLTDESIHIRYTTDSIHHRYDSPVNEYIYL